MFDEKAVLKSTLYLTGLLTMAVIWFSRRAAAGLALGGLMAALAFRLLAIDSALLLHSFKQGRISHDNISKHVRKGYLRRLIMYAAVLITGLISPYISFPTALIGLLIPRIAIYIHLFLGRKTGGS